MNDFLTRTYYHNTIQEYLIALGIIVIAFIAIKLLKNIFLVRLKRLTSHTRNHIDDYIIGSISRFGIPALYVLAVYVGLNYLTFTEKVQDILHIAVTVAITFYIIRFISSTILSLLQSYIRKRSDEDHGEDRVKQLGGIMLIINIIIWALGLIFLFDNMGFDVTAVIAGMGIGGIAIALAAQNILGDLFNYFVIFFDKPFEIGDFIIVDDKLGTIEYIGIKTTRVKSLSGEQLVFSNSDLTNSRIHNYKRMGTRRIVFKVGVIYETPYDKLNQIPGLLKSIVEEQEGKTVFDRAHFLAFGEYSFDFEVVHIVQSADFNYYMDVQQQINYRILEEFEKMGVKIAYPARTLWFANPVDVKQDGQAAKKDPVGNGVERKDPVKKPSDRH